MFSAVYLSPKSQKRRRVECRTERYVPFHPVPSVERVEVEKDVRDHADEVEAVRDEDEEQRRRRVVAVGQY